VGSRAYTLASAVVALSLLEIARRIRRLRRKAPLLEAAAVDVPATSILVPARNEEANIGDCVASLLGQGEAAIVVIDDGSTDRTAAIVQEMQAEERRVELIAAGELPPNWRGKVHALAVGLSRVETPWVLLTDADTRHAPGLLAKAHATAARWGGLDSLSLTGFQEVRGLGENLLTPLVFAVLDGLLGDWVGAAKGEMAVANGQYILVRREALLAIGGFESIRRVPIDDVALAARLHAAGFRGGFFRAPTEL
jgi:chlorobactene glucosyltransferase